MNGIEEKERSAYIEEIIKQIDILYEPIPAEFKNIDIDDPAFKSKMQEMRDVENTISCLEDSANE